MRLPWLLCQQLKEKKLVRQCGAHGVSDDCMSKAYFSHSANKDEGAECDLRQSQVENCVARTQSLSTNIAQRWHRCVEDALSAEQH